MTIMKITNAPDRLQTLQSDHNRATGNCYHGESLDVYGATSNVVILGSGLYMAPPYTPSYYINHILRVLCINTSKHLKLLL